MDSVVSGEAVVLEVPVARFPSRMLAIAIDIAIQLVALAIVLVAVGATQASGARPPRTWPLFWPNGAPARWPG